MTCIPLELKPLDGQKKGDINCDGDVNIADAVSLQQFILGADSSCAHGADLNSDGELDVFDLISLREMLIEK